MNREQQARAAEPQELGIASVETRGAAWPVAETEGYRISLGISDE